MQNLLLIVKDDNVWLKVGHTKVGRDGPSTCGFAAWQITEHFELCIHTVCNIVDEVVVSPCVALCVKHDLAAVEVMVCCSSVSTQFAFVRRCALPSFEIRRCGQSVNGGI